MLVDPQVQAVVCQAQDGPEGETDVRGLGSGTAGLWLLHATTWNGAKYSESRMWCTNVRQTRAVRHLPLRTFPRGMTPGILF